MSIKAPILLTDEQIREYIVNGYVALTPSVPDELHEVINRKLTAIVNEGPNPGNNVLPRVPEMRHILNSPEVRGALISALGEDYLEHPHRYCHHLGPAAEPEPNPAERLARNCHQDAYTPLGRPRQHYSRYARIMYYPQDTPIELGPTHVIPGTQYQRGLTDADRKRAIPLAGKAGTVSLTHFDVGHAAGVNLLPQHRHMIKFIYARGSEPTAPAWDSQTTDWRKPQNIATSADLELAWAHIWDWMCGKRDRYETLRSNGGKPTNGNLSDLIERLNTDDQAARVNAIYTLGAIGESAIELLMEALKTAGRLEDEHPEPRPWNEGAILMDDATFALTAVGEPAVGALTEALESPSEWVRINAAFALGELDSHAASAVPRLTEHLNEASHRVVRTATDSLGSIHQNADAFIPLLSRLLTETKPDWVGAERRGWTAQDQVRTNAAMAFARLGKDAAGAEDILRHALDDPCGHVGAFARDALKRIGSPSALEALMAYLDAQRWDESIRADRQF